MTIIPSFNYIKDKREIKIKIKITKNPKIVLMWVAMCSGHPLTGGVFGPWDQAAGGQRKATESVFFEASSDGKCVFGGRNWGGVRKSLQWL